MCYEIGKIYRGENFTMREAARTAAVVGIACVAGKGLALELLNWLPGYGWLVKGGVATSTIKLMGEAIIKHFEAVDHQDGEQSK